MTDSGQTKTSKIGLEHLREQREITTEKWSKMGLLEGLDGNVRETVSKLFETQLSFRVPDDDTGDYLPIAKTVSDKIEKLKKE